jgi:hypothetical protein
VLELARTIADLAAEFACIAPSARHPIGAESVVAMLEESPYLKERLFAGLIEPGNAPHAGIAGIPPR